MDDAPERCFGPPFEKAGKPEVVFVPHPAGCHSVAPGVNPGSGWRKSRPSCRKAPFFEKEGRSEGRHGGLPLQVQECRGGHPGSPLPGSLLLLLLLLLPIPLFALEVPFLAGRVNDLAGMLSPEEEQRIESKLTALEEATGAQVVVLTVPSLEGENLEDYSLRVADQWRLGQGGKDNGALLLIARDDRKMRLEVGYDLEGTLTDALGRCVLDDVLQPRFRQGDFGGGIEAGSEAIAALIAGDPSALPVAGSGRQAAQPPWPARLGMGALIFGVLGLFANLGLFNKGGEGWFFYVFLLPFWTLFPGALFGFRVGLICAVVWIVGFPLLRILLWHTGWGKNLRENSSWARNLERTASRRGGGGRGGGFSSGGSSSGGFSGGGGSFGGGGASSGW